ncbi:MAG: flagellar protein FliS [Lachnospiraceae bacterium]|nr:flagellar protein FliS [Lachnospiraceae bacterium]
MDNMRKQDFTRRIAQSNRGQLVVIMYEICFAYLEEAREACQNNEEKAYRDSVRRADRVVAQLQDSLNFRYGLSEELYNLYDFCRRELMKALYQRNEQCLMNVEKILRNLYTGFQQAAKQDQSEPLMHNTQQVYAGMTYGKEHLNENLNDPGNSRGFFA